MNAVVGPFGAARFGGTITSEEAANFEVFRNRNVPMATQPFVTILKSGMLSISAAAHELLGAPEAVELMYDAARNTIGLRGVPATEPHAYPMRVVGGKAGGAAGAYVISATAFLNFFGIRSGVSLRWVAAVVDGVLAVDLRGEGTPVTSNRATRANQRERGPHSSP